MFRRERDCRLATRRFLSTARILRFSTFATCGGDGARERRRTLGPRAFHDIDHLIDDASGDALDAVLCLLQAAWALQQQRQGHGNWGLPDFDPLEGWIVSA